MLLVTPFKFLLIDIVVAQFARGIDGQALTTRDHAATEQPWDDWSSSSKGSISCPLPSTITISVPGISTTSVETIVSQLTQTVTLPALTVTKTVSESGSGGTQTITTTISKDHTATITTATTFSENHTTTITTATPLCGGGTTYITSNFYGNATTTVTKTMSSNVTNTVTQTVTSVIPGPTSCGNSSDIDINIIVIAIEKYFNTTFITNFDQSFFGLFNTTFVDTIDIAINKSLNGSIFDSFNQTLVDTIDIAINKSLNSSIFDSFNQTLVDTIDIAINKSLNGPFIETFNKTLIDTIDLAINQSVTRSLNNTYVHIDNSSIDYLNRSISTSLVGYLDYEFSDQTSNFYNNFNHSITYNTNLSNSSLSYLNNSISDTLYAYLHLQYSNHSSDLYNELSNITVNFNPWWGIALLVLLIVFGILILLGLAWLIWKSLNHRKKGYCERCHRPSEQCICNEQN